MSNVKISALPSGTLVAGSEFPVNNTGTTQKVTLATQLTAIATNTSNIASNTSAIATLQTQATGNPVLTPMDQSAWSWDNQGGASVTQGNGIVWLQCPAGSAAENLRIRYTTAPSTPYKFASKVVPNSIFQVDFHLMGICLRENATGKVCVMLVQSGSGASVFSVRKNTDSTHNSSATVSANLPPTIGGPYYFRVGNNGTNVTYEYSMDGFNYTTLLSETKGTFFTTAPDQVGIAAAAMNVTVGCGVSYYSWVQS